MTQDTIRTQTCQCLFYFILNALMKRYVNLYAIKHKASLDLYIYICKLYIYIYKSIEIYIYISSFFPISFLMYKNLCFCCFMEIKINLKKLIQ